MSPNQRINTQNEFSIERLKDFNGIMFPHYILHPWKFHNMPNSISNIHVCKVISFESNAQKILSSGS